MGFFGPSVEQIVAAALKELAPSLDALVRKSVIELLGQDPEVRNIIRRAVKEHLEVMRDELVELDRANRDLTENLSDFFASFDELKEEVATLRRALLRGLPPPNETE